MTKPLIAVAIITNGSSPNLMRIFQKWISDGFVLGRTLYFCGPRQRLVGNGIDEIGIIDYVDPPYYRNNFHINDKKRAACEAIDAEYIYLVHDRFVPQIGLFDTLNRVLSIADIDFGAVDVDNEDGTPAIRELRLRNVAASIELESALEPLGRLTCAVEDSAASIHIAVNGGQFFLRKSKTKFLERPMRWAEMEDDVLSHDLRASRGLWIKDCSLITLVPRIAPNFDYDKGTQLKYWLYRLVCNILGIFTRSLSVGQKLDRNKLRDQLQGQQLLIDPLHKIYSSDFLPSSLEKIMTRARVASNGASWENVKEHPLGWKLIGYQGENK